MICIGIDPSKGFAVWDSKGKKFVEILTTDFWSIIDWLDNYKNALPRDELVVYCEAPQKNKPVWFSDKLIKERGVGVVEAMKRKVAQNVGSNKREAELIIQHCIRSRISVHECKPTKKSSTKLSAEEFGRITGYTKRTSEHGRDAAMLVWGM